MGFFDFIRRLFGGGAAAGTTEDTLESEEALQEASPELVSRPPPAKRRRRRRRATARRYHLGLDWGTSATKMVLRDLGDPRYERGLGYLLLGPNGTERFPSTVAIAAGRVFFGDQAENARDPSQIIHSLKALVAVERNWDQESGDSGLCAIDLAVLSVAHFQAVAFKKAKAHAKSLGQECRFGSTLSVPVARLQVPRTQKAYLDVARLAYQLAVKDEWDPQGRSVAECLGRLAEARDALPPRHDDDFDRYLRAEVVAAMVWPFRSPALAEGPYTLIDVGAATTNASWFRIHQTRGANGEYVRKGGIAFMGAATAAPGMDAFGAAVAPAGVSVAQVRGREEALFKAGNNPAAAVGVTERMNGVWAKARRAAWHRDGKLDNWKGLGIILVGGGSSVSSIRERFVSPPGYGRNIEEVYRVETPGLPPDLCQADTLGSGVNLGLPRARFILVAYGLSFPSGDLPDIAHPNEVSPFRLSLTQRDFKDSTDLGYSGA